VTLLTLIWVERRLLEKERLERQVQARTQQLASLTAVSADAIFSLDAGRAITSWNRGAEKMLGYQETAIVGQPLSRLIPEADTLASQFHEQDTIKDFETSAITFSGRRLTVDLTESRLTEADEGSPLSLIIMRDVTTRREREAIREEERARIARDLHDGVAQILYFMALKADMAGQQVAQEPDRVAAELKEIGRTARRVIREVRRTIFALRPLDWSHGNFVQALISFTEGFAEQVGWQVTVDVGNSDITIPARLEPTVFRLVQESLNNVAKHAEASHVWLSLHLAGDDPLLDLRVQDNGLGFDPAVVPGAGLGLGQMRERVSTLGGTLQIESQPGEGTTVIALLPESGLELGMNHG
jgi:PAS domain S-box-containing protein